jgi:hypothetical protein
MAMRLLKVMREQNRYQRGYFVYADQAAAELGIEIGSEELDSFLHDLVRAGYLQESAKPALTAQYVYMITHDGMDAADNFFYQRAPRPSDHERHGAGD